MFHSAVIKLNFDIWSFEWIYFTLGMNIITVVRSTVVLLKDCWINSSHMHSWRFMSIPAPTHFLEMFSILTSIHVLSFAGQWLFLCANPGFLVALNYFLWVHAVLSGLICSCVSAAIGFSCQHHWTHISLIFCAVISQIHLTIDHLLFTATKRNNFYLNVLSR